eukprot:CAMPEP_0185467470 /NCGR_PEP_ID=MMETSP1365-20130426/97247_1 /TAXON_ID=38817 /ORGANISM="Gephyrocapsa oceanica, Strain RCC1303" /LENGTH=156 /DNA_ID=CAMNT_0028074207 /DNA_START=77 /DNA_END=548 /DNA_ORIENTATION=-
MYYIILCIVMPCSGQRQCLSLGPSGKGGGLVSPMWDQCGGCADRAIDSSELRLTTDRGKAAKWASTGRTLWQQQQCSDDCALPHRGLGIAGRRGLAGTLLVHKVAAAEDGAEKTKIMEAHAGRSSYVPIEVLRDVPDPGAKAAACWLSAIAKAAAE